MSKTLKKYPFGFIFSDFELQNLPHNYHETIIFNQYYYYFDKDVKKHLFEKDNSFILIHGDYVHVGITNLLNDDELLEDLLINYHNDYSEFLNTLDFIGGRYTIILGTNDTIFVFPDAAHTRSTYYTLDKNIISSHVHLINDQIKNRRSNISYAISNALYYTPYDNIRSLIPNHFVNLKSKKYTRFFPRENNKFKYVEEEEKFQLFERFWKEQAQYFFNKYENFVLSLSGGGDSRFTMAMLRDHLEKIQFFTYANNDTFDERNATSKMLSIDNIIVKQILRDINIKHNFFYLDKEKRALTEEENKIVNKNTISKHSAYLIPFFLNNYPQNNLKHFRANLLEIGQARYLRNKLKNSSLKEVGLTFDNKYKKFLKDSDDISLYRKQYNEFIEKLNYGTNVYDYHLLDMYNWEMRLSRWHSEILNTHDPVFDTITLYNHRALIDVSLSFSYEKRRDEYMFKELINRNFPILNFYGDNNVLNLYEQNRNEYYKNKN